MAVVYKPIDGEQVSYEWWICLRECRNDGVPFHVNEGHRTMARQAYFYSGYIRHLPGFNLAAVPSPFAPHIRTGRFDHAIDFNGAEVVRVWFQRHGVTLTRTVRGEEWHLEANASQLKALARSFNGDPIVKPGTRGKDATRVRKLLVGLHLLKSASPAIIGPGAVQAIKHFQRAHHLPTDGVVGPKTWAAMRKASG